MIRPTAAHQFGISFCRALGLDPDTTGDVVVRIPVEGVWTIEATHIVVEEQAEQAIKVLKKYTLEVKDITE
jgi:hypothetical protein